MNDPQKNDFSDQVKEWAARIHELLNDNDLETILKIISGITQKQQLGALEQYFLIHYNYNFKTRFFQLGDFNQCMMLSNVLNKRVLL
jgi:hypothetical protein